MTDECKFPHLNDCHLNAQCIEQDEGYDCRCNQGFKDMRPDHPGRVCQQMINECASPNLNSCDKNAKCVDLEDGYRCECKKGFLDVSPSQSLPGRACRQSMFCLWRIPFKPGCLVVNECLDSKLNDCDKLARCIDTLDSYTCECPPMSKDISPNPAFPGRVCLVFENECETGKHDCDHNAICHDNEQVRSCTVYASSTLPLVVHMRMQRKVHGPIAQ